MRHDYAGTAKRSFPQALKHLLATEYGLLGSQRILAVLVTDIQNLVTQFYPPQQHLQQGWMLFTGTKASGHRYGCGFEVCPPYR